MDFPLPVEPIIAVVSPGLAVKLMSEITYSSAPGYLKHTFLNSTTPFYRKKIRLIALDYPDPMTTSVYNFDYPLSRNRSPRKHYRNHGNHEE